MRCVYVCGFSGVARPLHSLQLSEEHTPPVTAVYIDFGWKCLSDCRLKCLILLCGRSKLWIGNQFELRLLRCHGLFLSALLSLSLTHLYPPSLLLYLSLCTPLSLPNALFHSQGYDLEMKWPQSSCWDKRSCVPYPLHREQWDRAPGHLVLFHLPNISLSLVLLQLSDIKTARKITILPDVASEVGMSWYEFKMLQL